MSNLISKQWGFTRSIAPHELIEQLQQEILVLRQQNKNLDLLQTYWRQAYFRLWEEYMEFEDLPGND